MGFVADVGWVVLEVYAIEIQMYSELRETKKLKVSVPLDFVINS